MSREIGLVVEFDGNRNIVMEGETYEYPIGGMICEYARFIPTELKEYIIQMPNYSAPLRGENGKCSESLFWIYEKLKEDKGVIAAVMVCTDLSNYLKDFYSGNEDQLADMFDYFNRDISEDRIAQFILEDSGYDSFGLSTLGQAFLTAYRGYADFYAAFKYSFDILVSDKDYESETIDRFLSLYTENADCQHIDFSILLYDQKFHSVYTITSSLSLLIFEAAHAMDAQTKFIKCKNCGKYFVTSGRSDSVYCGFPSPQDPKHACRDIGAKATQAKKMKNDIVTQEYRRLYMRLKMAIKRHPEDAYLEVKLKKLTEEMKEMRKRREAGDVSSDDILEWLHQIENDL